MTVLNQRKRISAEDNTIVKNIEMTLAENNDIVFKFYKQNYINELSEEEISTFNISLGEYYKKSYIDDSFYTKAELDTKFDSLVGFTVSIVSELPSTGENGVMYLVPSVDGETGNTYIEYIWADNKFEKIGDTTTKVNLTDYYTKAQVDSQISTQMQNYHLGVFRDELSKKADKTHTHEDATINKSGFMSASDKSKLDSLNENGNITIDTSLSLTSGNPVSNGVITQALNEKANVSHTHSIGDISNLQSVLNGKANTSHTHNDIYYTKAQVGTQISTQLQDYHLGVFRDELTRKADKTHTHEDATISKSGFMSASDKSKLDSLNESGDIIIDTSLSLTSGNPVSNRVITQALNGKASTDAVSTSLNGLMSKDDKIKLDGIEEQANAYVLPFAEDTVLGGVKLRDKLDPAPADTRIGLKLDNGVLSIKGLLASQIFISPSSLDDKTQSDFNTDIVNQVESKADAVHTHDVVTQSNNGFLSKEDKVKLDGIAEGANKTIVDSSLSSTSVNPVQSKIINSALNEKANVSHTHSIGDISNLQSTLNKKANTTHTHSDTYYTKNEIDTRLGDIETILNEILGV